MGIDLKKMQVIIEADKSKLTKAAKEAVQDVKKMTADINKEIANTGKLDTVGAQNKKQIQNMTSMLKNMTSNIGTGAYKNAMKELVKTPDMTAIKGMVTEIQDYIREVQIASGLRVPTEGWENNERSITECEQALSRLQEREAQMQLSGADQKSKTWQSLQYDIQKVSADLDKLYEKEREMETSGRASEENSVWNNLQREILKAEQALQRYQDRRAKMIAIGADQESASWRRLQQEIQSAEDDLNHYQASRNEMLANGTDTQLSIDTSGTAGKLREVAATTKEVIARIPLIGRIAQSSGSIASKAFHGMLVVLKVTTSEIKACSGGFSALINRFSSGIPLLSRFSGGIRQNGNAFNAGLGSILKYGLGIRSLYALMGRLRSALQDGFTNLANYSQSTNNSLSALKGGLSSLSNSLAVVFAPVLDVVVPILSTLIDYCIAAANAIAHFFAALTGAGSYTIAKRVTSDFASGASSAGNAASDAADKAEKLKRTLMGFDEVNKLEDNSDSGNGSGGGGGGGGAGGGDMFATEEVTTAMSETAEKIKAYFQDIFRPMQDAWNTYGQGVIDAWKQALDDVLALLEDIALTFRDVWVNGTGEEVCGNILLLLQQAGEAISAIAVAFKDAWDDNNKGYNYIQSIFNKFNSILSLIRTIGDSLLTVWNNGSGAAVIGNILSIFTSINQMIANIATNFKNAWNDGGGTAVVQNLANILNTALDHVKNITAYFEEWSSEIDYTPLVRAFDKLTKSLEPLADKVGGGLETLFKEVLNPLAEWATENGIPAVIDLISGAFSLLDGVLELAQPVLKWVWEDFLEPLASWTGGTVVALLEGLGSAFSELGDGLKALKEGFETFIDNFFNSDEGDWGLTEDMMWEKKLRMEVDFVDGKFIDSETGKEWVKDENGYYHLDGAMDVEEITNNSNSVVRAPIDALGLTNKERHDLKTIVDASDLTNSQKLALKTAIDADKLTNSQKCILAAKIDASDLSNTQKKRLLAAINASSINANGKSASASVNVSKFNSGNKTASAPFKISKYSNKPTISAKAKITGQVNTPTVSVLARVNSIRSSFRAKGGVYRNGFWNSIPQYASGGSPHGTMFIAGEAGPEIVGHVGGRTEVLNKSQIAATVSAGVYQAVIAANAQNSGGKQGNVFNIYVGGKQVTDVVIEDVNNRTKATGSCPILT